ncbi:MAG TPA: hypothetical protein VIM41_09675 [Gammaproteobacteria bacterium]
MATQIILLVHGMGVHPPGEITATFKKALKDRINCFDMDFDLDQADCGFEEYNYSVLFDEVRQQFAENAAARQAGFNFLAGGGFAAELIQELTALEAKFNNDEFLYTHWLDVLLYGTTYFGARIRAQLAAQYNDLVAQHGAGNIHVICHSLGTAVVHDTFAQLYRHGANIFDGIPDYVPGNFNCKTLWTFANVSRLVNLLNSLDDPGQSTVAPGANGCADFFYNVRHKLDPFTWFKQYKREMDELRHIENEVVRNINTHDFYEYVTAPVVARRILLMIFDERVKQDKFDACVTQYAQGTINEGVADLKNALAAIRDKPNLDDLQKAYEAYKVLVTAVKKAGQEI